MKKSLLICEDHPVVLRGLVSELADHSALEVVKTVQKGSDLLPAFGAVIVGSLVLLASEVGWLETTGPIPIFSNWKEGEGLRNIRSRIDSLNGKLEINTTNAGVQMLLTVSCA